MKFCTTILFCCLSAAFLSAQSFQQTQLQVLSASSTETRLQLTLSGVDQTPVTTPAGPASVVSFRQGTPLLLKGAPDLPKLATALLIPNKGNMAVEILSADFDDYPGVAVAPSKGNLKRTVNPANIPYEFGQEYTRDQFFPGKLADLQAPFILRDARGQALWIYPVQYNPVQQVLRVYRSLTVRVYVAAAAGKNELADGAPRYISPAFSQLYHRFFVNANAPAAGRGGNLPEKMLVIAKDELIDELEPLVTWKRQMGIHTTVVPMSEIGSPESAAVYNFVKKYYVDHAITYLMLVGDEASIQPEMREDGDSYSCDNCFGYLEGDDHFPEILVGRLHAATPEQLRIMVNRNLEYEKNPLVDSTQNWCATGMASCSNQGEGIGDDGQADWQQGNEWKAAHLAAGFEKYWEFYDGSHNAESPTPGDISADQDGDPNYTPLVDLMNGRGVSLYNYTGHGWEQGLVSGNFSTDAVAELRNTGRYPIIIAVACCAGNFTNGECLGEAWQRAGNPATGEPWGGIAGFFSSDFQSWSPPMEGQDGMNQYLLDAGSNKLHPNLAGMLAYGNARMIAAYSQDGELMADFWNPFAEPTTVPRTALPKTLSAAYAASVPFETTQITVNCPVEGALVSLFWQNQTWAAGRVENGAAVLDIAPLNNVGDIIVTVSGFNYIPFQGTIAVQAATKPFVVALNSSLDDPDGNNNQKADFGETVNLKVLFSNIGLGNAGNVTAMLSSADPFVTLQNSTAALGDLGSQDSSAAAFTFLVSDAVEHGHKVEFLLDLVYNDTVHLNTALPVTLNAPELGIGAWTIDDSAGGNGNKRLESGETAILRIKNLNHGGSNSPDAIGALTTASPYLTIGAPALIGPLGAVTGEKEAEFTIEISAGAPVSAMITLNYQLQAGHYGAEKAIQPVIINPIVETFESNNFSSFAWQMSGNKPWSISTSNPYAGQYCSRSGTITHNQKSTMGLTLLVSEDGIVSFARRVSSEADYDFLRFYIDNEVVGAWSGNVAWSEVSFPVAAGQHSFTWSYEKDDLVSDGSDRAWVDEIILPPHKVAVDAWSPSAAQIGATAAPNPTYGPVTLYLDLPAEQILGIQVFDQLGRPVQSVQTPARMPAGLQTRELDLGALPPGVYLLVIQGEKGMQTIRVLR